MTNPIDQDQQWLLNCLSATLDPNQDVRSFAETSLKQASLQPGFGAALCKVAASREIPVGLRQLAAVLLKQFIKKHWQEGDENFEHPAVSNEEKEVIRSHLLMSLDDSHGKICTAIGMAVASIAVYDWPEGWPDLLPLLLKLITEPTNMSGVHGALRCLALLSGDLDDTMMPTLVPTLFPSLHNIVSSPQIFDKHLRTKALTIVYSCISILGSMSGVYKSETSALVTPMLKPWMDQFSIILGSPVQSDDPDDWTLRMEVLKCLNQIVLHFSTLTESEFTVVVGSLWQTFVSSLSAYIRSSVEGVEDPYEGRYDSDGTERSLESFVIQLFEFLLTIVGKAKFAKVVTNYLKELVYYTIAFLQVTEYQVQSWSADANQFVSDEDDVTYSCRVSGSILLDAIVECYSVEGIEAVIYAAEKRFSESQQEKAAGSVAWWRMWEATLYALASLSEQNIEGELSDPSKVNIGTLLEKMLTEDIGGGLHECPFLLARIFTSVAKFFSVISHSILEHFLHAAINAIGMDVAAPVKVGACRAISQLLPVSRKGVIHSHMTALFSSLINLLNQASDETLHLVLETLQATVKAGHEATASIEAIISPVILNVWASHVLDPFIGIDAIEVLEAIKNCPGCIHPLVSRVLPFVGPILNKPQEQSDGLVAGSLDLVTMLLKTAPQDVVKIIYDVCFDAVIRIILQSDDHGELQNATECLSAIISGGRQEVLAWGGDSGFAMRGLLDAASRLLDPNLESSGALFTGNYILQLILHLPSQMAQHIRDLVAALIRRMQSAKIYGLRNSLILIFARLVHMSTPNVDQFIDLLISIPAEGYGNSFAYLMSDWSKQQGDIQGAYQIKVTTSALAILLSTRHSELLKINVEGHLMKSDSGITTRSKAKLARDQWSIVPLPVKILALLADALIEMQEQTLDDDDESSDWEEVGGGEAETDKELFSAAAISSGRRPYEDHEALAKLYDENLEDDCEDGFLTAADPLNEINLANYLVSFLENFSNSDRHVFEQLCQNLTPAQRKIIHIALHH